MRWCGSASFWCRSGSDLLFRCRSGSDLPFWCRSRSRYWIYPRIIFVFKSNQCQLTLFLSLVSVKGFIIFRILDSILKFSVKMLSSSLLWGETDTNPDPAKWSWSDPDPQVHITGFKHTLKLHDGTYCQCVTGMFYHYIILFLLFYSLTGYCAYIQNKNVWSSENTR